MAHYFQVQSDLFSYGLSPHGIAVYTNLAMRRNRQTGTAWPAVATIADECGMGESTVRRSIKELKEKGLITVTPHYQPTHRGQNRQTANIYSLPGLDAACDPRPVYGREGPPADGGAEIDTTNLTPTESTEPSTSEQTADEDVFRHISEDCLFHPDELCNYPSAELIPLAKRALKQLWQKTAVTLDGIRYEQSEIRRLLSEELSPEELRDAMESYLNAEDIRHPTAYLGSCILSSALNYAGKIAAQADRDRRNGKW